MLYLLLMSPVGLERKNTFIFAGRRYNGYRYGPESEMKYEYTSHHWLQLCARFAFIIVFEVITFELYWTISVGGIPLQTFTFVSF